LGHLLTGARTKSSELRPARPS